MEGKKTAEMNDEAYITMGKLHNIGQLPKM